MIKKLLRYTLLFSFSLLTANHIWQNITFGKQLETVISVAAVLALFEIFVKPIVKLLLLPITIITLGTIRIIIDTVGLYLATMLIPEAIIGNIATSSFTWQGFSVPAFNFSGLFAYIATSFTISICYNIFNFIVKKSTSK